MKSSHVAIAIIIVLGCAAVGYFGLTSKPEQAGQKADTPPAEVGVVKVVFG